MSKINCRREILPHPSIKLATPDYKYALLNELIKWVCHLVTIYYVNVGVVSDWTHDPLHSCFVPVNHRLGIHWLDTLTEIVWQDLNLYFKQLYHLNLKQILSVNNVGYTWHNQAAARQNKVSHKKVSMKLYCLLENYNAIISGIALTLIDQTFSRVQIQCLSQDSNSWYQRSCDLIMSMTFTGHHQHLSCWNQN